MFRLPKTHRWNANHFKKGTWNLVSILSALDRTDFMRKKTPILGIIFRTAVTPSAADGSSNRKTAMESK